VAARAQVVTPPDLSEFEARGWPDTAEFTEAYAPVLRRPNPEYNELVSALRRMRAWLSLRAWALPEVMRRCRLLRCSSVRVKGYFWGSQSG